MRHRGDKQPTSLPARPACRHTQVHFLIAACENMVDARGLRPGDILVASNGGWVGASTWDQHSPHVICPHTAVCILVASMQQAGAA